MKILLYFLLVLKLVAAPAVQNDVGSFVTQLPVALDTIGNIINNIGDNLSELGNPSFIIWTIKFLPNINNIIRLSEVAKNQFSHLGQSVNYLNSSIRLTTIGQKLTELSNVKHHIQQNMIQYVTINPLTDLSYQRGSVGLPTKLFNNMLKGAGNTSEQFKRFSQVIYEIINEIYRLGLQNVNLQKLGMDANAIVLAIDTIGKTYVNVSQVAKNIQHALAALPTETHQSNGIDFTYINIPSFLQTLSSEFGKFGNATHQTGSAYKNLASKLANLSQ